MGFAGAVKMATLELYLNPGQSPNSQQCVLRKAEKNVQMVQCTVHTDGGRGAFSDRLCGREPTSEKASFRAASSAHSSKTLYEWCSGPSIESGLAMATVIRIEVQELGTLWNWIRERV